MTEITALLSRRHLLRAGVLAPFAPLAAAASQKLGAIGSGIQKVTAQSAVQQFVTNLQRSAADSKGIYGISIQRIEYVGELGIVRWAERMPMYNIVDGEAVRLVGQARTNQLVNVFNAGKEAVHYMGRIIPPGQWYTFDQIVQVGQPLR
jgi:hypothetical protein